MDHLLLHDHNLGLIGRWLVHRGLSVGNLLVNWLLSDWDWLIHGLSSRGSIVAWLTSDGHGLIVLLLVVLSGVLLLVG